MAKVRHKARNRNRNRFLQAYWAIEDMGCQVCRRGGTWIFF